MAGCMDAYTGGHAAILRLSVELVQAMLCLMPVLVLLFCLIRLFPVVDVEQAGRLTGKGQKRGAPDSQVMNRKG